MHSNLTRVVMVSWLFLVLILTSCYTASLSSMLTVKQLRPKVTDIQWLKNNNKKVGCAGDSFVRTFLEKVEKFKPENIINITNIYKYDEAFANNSIAAAFLELPYEKVFMMEYCKKYTGFIPRNRFGGLGFMFQKGSPLTKDFSKAILHLSENAELKRLEELWLSTSQDCSNVTSSNDTDSLNLKSLWALYAISGASSTICVLLSAIRCLKSRETHEDVRPEGNRAPNDERVKAVITFAKKIHRKKLDASNKVRDVTDPSLRPGDVSVSITDTPDPEHSQEMASQTKEVHITTTHDNDIGTMEPYRLQNNCHIRRSKSTP